ncbi:hypothetical protein ACLUW2_08250 [Limosilactobacillus balticus]|uniref:hypothetical protein n=1 Tax=Limosilactobacillus balticus TaxID=2759747 RepID=UPI0039960ADF
MIWVHYFYEGQALIIWGALLLISICITEFLLKFVTKIVFLRSYTNELILGLFGILLFMRGYLFSAGLASLVGLLSIVAGIILALLRKKHYRLLKWENWIIGVVFLLAGLCFRAVDLLLVGILYIGFIFFGKFLKKKAVNNFIVLSGILIFVGIGLWSVSYIQLRSPFLEINRNIVTLDEKEAKLKIIANPDSKVEVWKHHKKLSREYTTDKYGMIKVKFYSPGDYELKTSKNDHLAKKKVYVKASKKYLSHKAHEELLKNNKNGVKEKLLITSKDLTWNKGQNDREYSVNIEGITDPNIPVTISEEYDEKKIHSDEKGNFKIKWESYSNDACEITIRVINNKKTKENSKKIKIKVNEELKKQEEQEKQKQKEEKSNSTSNDRPADLLINEHNDDNKYKNSSALKVAVEDYIMDHHPRAEVDPFNYEIKKISDGMYEIYGSYDNENGVKQHYVALAMDDGTSKVEILQLANQN